MANTTFDSLPRLQRRGILVIGNWLSKAGAGLACNAPLNINFRVVLNTLLFIPHSPFPITHSPFPITHSPFPITHYPFPITHYPFPIPHSPLPITDL